MLVSCQVDKCHYCVDGYCTAKVVNINEKAGCSHIFVRGQIDQFAFTPLDDEYKDMTSIPLIQEQYQAAFFSPSVEMEIVHIKPKHIIKKKAGFRRTYARVVKKTKDKAQLLQDIRLP